MEKDVRNSFECTDAAELSAQVYDWTLEFTQLSAGSFSASGDLVQLDSMLIGRINTDQTLRQRGYAPRNTVAVSLPGRGSSPAFIRGRQVASDQCVVVGNGACLDVITRDGYVDIGIAVDLDAWAEQSQWLHSRPEADWNGTRIATPGKAWVNSVLDAVDWIFDAGDQYPAALRCDDVRASLSDQFLATVTNMGGGVEQNRDARTHRRLAVERARDYIHSNLTEQLRLSDLCRYARVQTRSLEYGFREIIGMSPFAYIKALRLSGVRRTLMSGAAPERSISEIACDQGFWHLSQFAVDYRKFFCETPSTTRQRVRAITAPKPNHKGLADFAFSR